MPRSFSLPIAVAVTAVVVTAFSGIAHAQYKNAAFGFDAGGWMVTKPAVVDSDAGNVLTIDERPLRLNAGLRIGGETNFKLDEDHWWFTGRLNIGFLRFSDGDVSDLEGQFDQAASDTLGTLMGIEAGMGVRYFIFTDRTRPYIQMGMSYLRLLTFTRQAGETCEDPQFCSGGSNANNFLPHPNIGIFHIQPGIEFIVSRNIALHFFVDLQHWLLINAQDNQSIVFGMGCNFYT